MDKKMTKVKFVEILNRCLMRFDDIVCVNNDGERISIRYYTYANSVNVVEKTVSTKHIYLNNNDILYHKLLKYFFDK